jgi:hypothetical protein
MIRFDIGESVRTAPLLQLLSDFAQKLLRASIGNRPEASRRVVVKSPDILGVLAKLSAILPRQ